ncbi:hypothetical protein N7528_004332 [Penicillium herquei]|nr:hypothetical protein N7528_004332 [Penicillium herquei]
MGGRPERAGLKGEGRKVEKREPERKREEEGVMPLSTRERSSSPRGPARRTMIQPHELTSWITLWTLIHQPLGNVQS